MPSRATDREEALPVRRISGQNQLASMDLTDALQPWQTVNSQRVDKPRSEIKGSKLRRYLKFVDISAIWLLSPAHANCPRSDRPQQFRE